MGQLELFEPSVYLQNNQNSNANFALCKKKEDGKFKQDILPVGSLLWAYKAYKDKPDIYISQALFYGERRRVINLASISLNFVDIDLDLRHLSQDQKVSLVHLYCKDRGILRPSLIVDSGRGLHLKWTHEYFLPSSVLPRWQAVQNCLVELFEDLGADKGAKDASRILRLVGSVNTRNGRTCEVIDYQGYDDRVQSYNFEMLCENILPIFRPELEKERKSKKNKIINISSYQAKTLNTSSLHWNRVLDIKKYLSCVVV